METRRPDWILERGNVRVSIWEEATPGVGVRWKMIQRDTTVRTTDRTVLCLMEDVQESLVQISSLCEVMAEARRWVEGRRSFWLQEVKEYKAQLEAERRKRAQKEVRRLKRLRTKYVDYYDK